MATKIQSFKDHLTVEGSDDRAERALTFGHTQLATTSKSPAKNKAMVIPRAGNGPTTYHADRAAAQTHIDTHGLGGSHQIVNASTEYAMELMAKLMSEGDDQTDFALMLESILLENYDSPVLMQDSLDDVKKSAAKLSAQARKATDALDGGTSDQHKKAANLHAIAAHEHRKALNMIHNKVDNLTYQIRNAAHPSSINNLHDGLLGELQSKRTDLENDSFDHSKEIASHHKEIGYHTSNVNEGTEMATLKSLSEAFSGILQAAKDKANTPPKKKYGERDGDEDDKKTYSGALGDALGIKAKKEPSKGDLTRGEMKGVGKVRRHVCTEGVDFTVYQVGTKFVAQIVEGEEVVFECAAPTEAGAIAQTNRIIEQTLEACAETQVASVEAAKSVAKKVTSK